MREILFRGKREDNGEWVESDSILPFEEHPITHSTGVQLWAVGEGWVWVEPDTVGQFTGLTDKNDNRIFEGDIVKGAWGTVFVVFYDECYLQFRAKKADSYAREIDYYGFSHEIEVIGNIHDNPELMEGEE